MGWYNSAVEPWLRLPDFGCPQSLAILVGNTRAMWPIFLAAARRDPELRAAVHPVERHAMNAVTAATRDLHFAVALRWAQTIGRGMVAMQRLAVVSGLAHLSPAGLAVHPTFGPWIALRAVAVIDVPGPGGAAPSAASPCDQCEVGCSRALRGMGPLPWGADWRRWLAVRDACPVGRQHRYDEDQIEYHYTKDRRVLERALATGA